MTTENYQIGDVGTIIRITVKEDGAVVNLSSATNKLFTFMKKARPDTTFARAADFVTDGTDGQLFYIVDEGDFTVAGEWKIQAFVALPPDKQFNSSIHSFCVLESLVVPN